MQSRKNARLLQSRLAQMQKVQRWTSPAAPLAMGLRQRWQVAVDGNGSVASNTKLFIHTASRGNCGQKSTQIFIMREIVSFFSLQRLRMKFMATEVHQYAFSALRYFCRCTSRQANAATRSAPSFGRSSLMVSYLFVFACMSDAKRGVFAVVHLRDLASPQPHSALLKLHRAWRGPHRYLPW